MSKTIDTNRANKAPTEFQLLPYGKIELEGEKSAFLDDGMMNQIIGHFESRGNDMVIDYEHQTLKDVQAPAAGWVKRLVNRGKQGLWAVVTWTEKAKQYLKNSEYRYFSPVFHVRKSDSKVFDILNVALTNSPKINHLNPIVAKADHDDPDLLELTLRIAKSFDLTEEDIRKYAGRDSHIDEVGEAAILNVAKVMDNTEEDIRKYGGIETSFDANSNGINDPTALEIAKMMGNTEEDIKRFGGVL